ncbi:MAG: DUF1553 domain-containing protein [Bacteroidota bacterium]
MIVLLCSCQNTKKEQLSFNRDIRPILNEKCLRCHGGVKANGGFSLLFESDAFSVTESGTPAIVRGNHTKSELYRRIVTQDPELRMPLDANSLSEREIDLLAQWIDQGARWEKHWAYDPPQKNISPPTIESTSWAKNEIDHFVYDKMRDNGLFPEPQAERRTLLRRLYLDLTGLPPTTLQVDDFLANRVPDAYEIEVDKVLASPHFGERWATVWLDLARYADSKGYEKDSNREIWKFRDYVINAFNANLPFNQFTIEQLAGDLLPDPTEDQLIATAFHRNSLANDEGGTDNEEFRVAAVLERVATTYEVWQGTTMSCVQCHDHPYDPFRQHEFYESMAYFNNARDNDSYFEEPKLFTYSPENKKKVVLLLDSIYRELPPHERIPEQKNLYQQVQEVLNMLGYRELQAESFYESSPFIELDNSLSALWQVQDSSWVKYENVDLGRVKKIGFFASAKLGLAGQIALHLDSLKGPNMGIVTIRRTGKERSDYREFTLEVDSLDGTHDIYLRFYKGEQYAGHLFYLDKMRLYETRPKMMDYSPELRKRLKALADMPTTSTPIIQELSAENSRITRVFERGSWLSPGEQVEQSIPDIYGLSGELIPQNRLDFARWMVNGSNPLTARVTVNRFWEQLFGSGLVASMEEFGSQGEKPTHPELLDWLAIRFMNRHKWHIKPLLKELVLSATYRQSSHADKDKIEKDVQNQWLARSSRTRLSAEQIRDQALAVSGLLNPTVGGPSVVNASVEGGWTGVPDWAIKGDSANYRRSLYTLWKRVTPPDGMLTFDSPDRSVCTSRRIRTNTPLQALNLLNDATFLEAANALALQMVRSENDLDKQLAFGYLQVMGRQPGEKKLILLRELYQNAEQFYEKNKAPDEFPLTLRDTGRNPKELAALVVVANALLNLDEFIVKG